jgi:hypothetical protein
MTLGCPRLRRALLLLPLLMLFSCLSARAQNVANYEAIPEPLLFLLREPAVHDELALTHQQRAGLVQFNQRFDGQLLASRNMPAEKAQEVGSRVLSASQQRIAELLDEKQQARLQQIAYRSRGISFVLAPDAAAKLQLSPDQQTRIEDVVRQTANEIARLQQQLQQGQTSAGAAQEEFFRHRKQEQQKVLEQLSAEQRERLVDLVGPRFDVTRLGRVSFLAPELPASRVWINSQPLSLAQLRGKVVALHFWTYG